MDRIVFRYFVLNSIKFVVGGRYFCAKKSNFSFWIMVHSLYSARMYILISSHVSCVTVLVDVCVCHFQEGR